MGQPNDSMDLKIGYKMKMLSAFDGCVVLDIRL